MTNGLSRRSLFGAAGGAIGLAVLSQLPAQAGDQPAAYPAGRPGSRPDHGALIGLIPLDDRPYTYWEPQQLAIAAGYRTVSPSRNELGRHTVPGDGDAIARWLRGPAKKADALVLALPMLAFGGLLNSRNSSVSLATARTRLRAVRDARRVDHSRRLFAFDTIMRLTPEGPWRNQLRDWATLVDEVINLGMQDKRPALEAIEKLIPQSVRDDYLATRERNHQVNLEMIGWAAEGIFDYLIIGQDDASGTGLHRPEALALAARIAELGVGDTVVLYPGADVNADLLISRLAIADAGIRPTVAVDYSRLSGEEWTAPFQNIRYAEVIRRYVTTIGGRIVEDPRRADIVLMANTGGNTASVQPFADRLVAHLAAGRTVALGDDAIAGRADYRLLPLLAGRMRYADLAGYSGWNIGLTLAQSFARLAVAQRCDHAGRQLRPADRDRILLAAGLASVQLSVSEWVQTDSYRNHVRDDTTAYATALGEPDPQNIASRYREINQYAVQHTIPFAQQMFDENFAGARIRLTGSTRAMIGRVQKWGVFLPWLRTGEIAAEPTVRLTRC